MARSPKKTRQASSRVRDFVEADQDTPNDLADEKDRKKTRKRQLTSQQKRSKQEALVNSLKQVHTQSRSSISPRKPSPKKKQLSSPSKGELFKNRPRTETAPSVKPRRTVEKLEKSIELGTEGSADESSDSESDADSASDSDPFQAEPDELENVGTEEARSTVVNSNYQPRIPKALLDFQKQPGEVDGLKSNLESRDLVAAAKPKGKPDALKALTIEGVSARHAAIDTESISLPVPPARFSSSSSPSVKKKKEVLTAKQLLFAKSVARSFFGPMFEAPLPGNNVLNSDCRCTFGLWPSRMDVELRANQHYSDLTRKSSTIWEDIDISDGVISVICRYHHNFLTALKTAATGIVADQLRLERNWRQGKARTGKNGEIKQKLNIDFSPQAAVQASPILAEYEKYLCSPQPVGLAPPALESYYQHDILFRIASKMCEIVSAPNELYRWTLPPADATWEKRRNTAFLFISFSYALIYTVLLRAQSAAADSIDPKLSLFDRSRLALATKCFSRLLKYPQYAPKQKRGENAQRSLVDKFFRFCAMEDDEDNHSSEEASTSDLEFS